MALYFCLGQNIQLIYYGSTRWMVQNRTLLVVNGSILRAFDGDPLPDPSEYRSAVAWTGA